MDKDSIIYKQTKKELNKFIELEIEFNLKYDESFEPVSYPPILDKNLLVKTQQITNNKEIELRLYHLIDNYEYNRIILTLVKSKLIKRIEEISDKDSINIYAFVLKSRYIYKNTLEKTADKLNYSSRHIRRLMNEAIQLYADKYTKTY
ncbi:MAG: hypothetical protein LBI03_00565 [Clostridiales bacterium]|jgi:hypothetical protein|nr:hypothetical protein [Clostridiales bacterium]